MSRVVIFQIILGAGIGPNFQALTIAFQSAVKSSDVGTATSTFRFIRNLANRLGLVLGESLVHPVGSKILHIKSAITGDTYQSVYGSLSRTSNGC